ncbi:MAG: zinc-binding dehydrogenase, partial [Anaerolineae bacterium]
MKAIVKTDPGPGHVAYTDFADPEARPGEVVIEVRAAGLCGTDMSLYDWKESMIREYKPEPPVVMGHEFAGIVSEVGPGVTRFKVGDRVTGNGIMYCGECYFCRSGRHGICVNRPMLGVGLNGCFAQFVSLRQGNVFPLPPDVPFEIASMTEVLCVALHTMERVPVGPGDTVVVGPGP